MSDDSPTPDQVVAAPELAVLHVLDAALTAARLALLAAHPEIEEQDLAGDNPLNLDGSGWIADGIVIHIASLESLLLRYRREVVRPRRPAVLFSPQF